MRFLYLHGFASGPASKKARAFAERLAAVGQELIVPDLAGGDFGGLTISGQLRVAGRAAADGPACVIGSSLGGYLAALLAARRPSAVAKVVLLAPAFAFSRIFADSLGEERVAEWRRTGRLPVFHYGAGETRDVGYQLAEDGRQYEDFPDFAQPALLFHGRRDASVPVALSEDFAAAHPNVRLRVMDSDHELLDVLDPVCAEAISFLTAAL